MQDRPQNVPHLQHCTVQGVCSTQHRANGAHAAHSTALYAARCLQFDAARQQYRVVRRTQGRVTAARAASYCIGRGVAVISCTLYSTSNASGVGSSSGSSSGAGPTTQLPKSRSFLPWAHWCQAISSQPVCSTVRQSVQLGGRCNAESLGECRVGVAVIAAIRSHRHLDETAEEGHRVLAECIARSLNVQGVRSGGDWMLGRAVDGWKPGHFHSSRAV